MPKKDGTLKVYEIGLKNRKAFTIEATRMTRGPYGSGDLTFHNGGEVVFIVAPQKWEYVRVVGTPLSKSSS